MSVIANVLFGRPQSEVATLISSKLAQSVATSIVTGFATPGGISAIGGPIKARPQSVDAIVVGASTYPGFQALDELIAAGIPMNRLFVHLGHTRLSGGQKNPVVRYHPMLHSKIYYMEFTNGDACAFIGSHNVTSFALTGLNGEAAVLLEGPKGSSEFVKVREHIKTSQLQATPYSQDMKEAFAWWTREFIEGMKAEIKIPPDWITIRTILIFATHDPGKVPSIGDDIYFELPAGIEQIESLKTEVHLFLFSTLPSDPWQAINRTNSATVKLTCMTIGVENKQGNRELDADWQVQGRISPKLIHEPTGKLRPSTPTGMQQVRCEVQSLEVPPFDYLFDRERTGWDPIFSQDNDDVLQPVGPASDGVDAEDVWFSKTADIGWKRVKGLAPRRGSAVLEDEAALKLAAPESGFFILVSLRRRRKDQNRKRDGKY
ncbi:MAG: hypothetical protein ACKVP0_18885 [Pirellulaceae bacterium]